MATVILSRWQWLWWVIGAMVPFLVLLFWGYRRAPLGALRWGCAFLKLLGLAALGLCLLEPTWLGQRARPGANLFALAADNSQSLRIRDPGAPADRGERLREWLQPAPNGWQALLEENYEVRRFLFDTRLQATRDFGELDFAGSATALDSALRSLRERFNGRPLAGVLLFTDGNATDLRTVPNLSGLPPVYPVILGGAGAILDVAVQDWQVTQTIFEDAPVQVQAGVRAAGYRGAAIQARLLDASGKIAATAEQVPRRDDEVLAFRFQLRPTQPGLCFYRLEAGEKSALLPAGGLAQGAEPTLANNRAVVVVDRPRGPYRVLYVSGRPNWEYKFLNRALQEDPELELVGLIRVANREPKFNFLGRAGETSNPLFRGFGEQGREEAGRYDQPVLVRLNTRDELELRAGFPGKAEELYAYHAVIVDDLEAAFFTPDQALLLQKFVSERGGGFLMLGGMESFQQGHYLRTPIGDMLPVYLDRVEATNAPASLHLDLTREGWLQPWARLRDNEADEKARLRDMPAFQVMNRVREVKPGASVVASARDEAGHTYPALVVQRFGRGRSAAFTIGDVWRWGMRNPSLHKDMDKAWRQLMRSLVVDVPARVELEAAGATNGPPGSVQLQVRVRDAKFQAMDDATVNLEVQQVMDTEGGGSTNSIRLRAEPSSREPGLYEASYYPRAAGGYRATALVANPNGTELGRAEAGFTSDRAAEEFRSVNPNTALLEAIAKATGGEVVEAGRLAAFARALPQRRAPVMEAWSFPLWHTPAMFAFALACLLAEWGLRRWKGLP